jgi:hypothetical protein
MSSVNDASQNVRQRLSDDEHLRFGDLLGMHGDALVKRGEEMVKLGRELLMQSGNVAGLVGREEVEHSVGRKGIITEKEAIDAALNLGEGWSRPDFAEELGLKPGPPTMKWLNKLINRPYPIVGRGEDGNYYYIAAPDSGARRRREPTAEQLAVDRSAAPKRGTPQRRSAVSKLGKRAGSIPGQRSFAKQRDERYERNNQKKK